MGIVRQYLSFEGNFTQVPNSIVRDKTLSLKARGLLFELMSHKPGWHITLESLVNDRDGLSAIKSAVAELKDAGWLSIDRERDEQNRLGHTKWILQEPQVDFPPVEKPPVENHTTKKTSNKEDEVKEENPLSPPRGRAKTPPHTLPEDWAPNASHKRKADALGVDVDELSKRMRQWAFANDIRRANWNNTFNQFLARAKPSPSSKIGGLAEFDRLVAADDKPAVEALLGERCREPAEIVELDVSVRAERFKAYFREWAAARRHKLAPS